MTTDGHHSAILALQPDLPRKAGAFSAHLTESEDSLVCEFTGYSYPVVFGGGSALAVTRLALTRREGGKPLESANLKDEAT